MLANQTLAVLVLAGVSFATVATAQERPATGDPSGFYGGVALRNEGSEAGGVNLDHVASAWGRFASPVADDKARRALVFGGYRWSNDIALEGSFSSADVYALRPADAAIRRGVGLSLIGSPELSAHTWNADVYTSWAFVRRLSLYGRLGYAQSEPVPGYALAAALPTDPRRLHDGVNYSVGLRYDVTPALGLRLEYARFQRFIAEGVAGALPDSDQVQFGMQFRF